MPSFKFLCLSILLLLSIIVNLQAIPVENVSSLSTTENDEMMDTAESQNPFLPRFAMKKLKERRQQARAQRRNFQGQRRHDVHQYHVNCQQRRYYCKFFVAF